MPFDWKMLGEALLRELPPDQVVWAPASGTYTAGQILSFLTGYGVDEMDIAKQYLSDLFRVARDLVGSRARRKVNNGGDP